MRTRRGLLAAVAGVGASAATVGCLDRPTSDRGPLDAAGDARLGLVGDVMLGRSVTDHWAGTADPAGVWGSTLPRLRALDGFVLNLECCVSARGDPRDKTYLFRADPSFAVPALSAADVSVAALANNHVLDFGPAALRDTLDNLQGAGVAHAGAGPSRSAALAPAVVEVGGLTVATLSLTDRYVASAAAGDRPGTAYLPMDPRTPDTRSTVRGALDRVADHDPDLVVASLHWGPNWETAPDDRQQAFARWLVDEGVDVVHGHSAHVLQGVEVYQGRPIVYDAGDFVDDYVDREDVVNKRSALFELVVADGDLRALRAVPTVIEDETAALAESTAATWVRETLRERSTALGTTVERADDGNGVVVPLDT